MPSPEKDQFDRMLERVAWRAFGFGMIVGAAVAFTVTIALQFAA